MMKPLGFIKHWKGLIILVVTAQLIFMFHLCLGQSNYMKAEVYYYECGSSDICLSVTCTFYKTQNPQQYSNVKLYIHRQNKLWDDFAYNLSNDQLDSKELSNQKAIISATCNDYDKTYTCKFTYEVENCGKTRNVYTSADVKLPENGCNNQVKFKYKETNASLVTNNAKCTTNNDGTTLKNDDNTPKNDGNTPKNDDNTPNNSQVVTTVAIVLPLFAVVATVAVAGL